MNNPPLRKDPSRYRFLLRVVLAAGILCWLISKLPLRSLMQVLGESIQQWPWWLAALAATFLGLLAGAARWHIILHTQQFPLSRATVFRLFFIGQFFNSFLPGGCGGDLARAYYAARLCAREKTRAASTVLVDRGIGLLTTLFFGCLMIVGRPRLFLSSTPLLLSAAVMLGSACGAAALLLLVLWRNPFTTAPFFQRLEKSQIGGLLKKVYEVAYYYRARPRILLLCIGCSLLNLFFLTMACFCFAKSLLLSMPLSGYFTMFPIITVLTAIPLTPGALGVREGLFANLFSTLGAATFRTIPLSLLVYSGGLFWSLFGGLLYILQPKHQRLGTMPPPA